jgi:SAM-dependent methyltransferase
MLDKLHEANRRYWDNLAPDWERLRDRDGLWRRCSREPALAFEGRALDFIREAVGRGWGDLHGTRACVIGSGDNYVAFALAGMGAAVTSVDIAAEQLAVAARRAGALDLDITFVRADAADLDPLDDAQFDLVCSSNGFFVWITAPERVFAAVHRVLKPGGHYIFYDVHPFLRPWKDQVSPIEMEEPYFETGPYVSEEATGPTYEHHWTMSDLLNAAADAGLVLRRVAETPAQDARFWEDHAYLPGDDVRLLDWRHNPRAGLPVWLTLDLQKP